MSDTDEILERLDRIKQLAALSAKPVLGVAEVADLTGYSIKTIYNKAIKRLIPYYKNDGKLFFDREEIIAWMKACRVPTKDEVGAKAATHVAMRPLKEIMRKKPNNKPKSTVK